MNLTSLFSKIRRNDSLKTIALPLVIGVLSGLLTMNSMEVFRTLQKPPLAPPALLFPIVWTLLYLLLGISFALIKAANASGELFSDAQSLYYYQLAANFLWPIFFFRYEWYLFSFFWLLFLWILVFAMIRTFIKIKPLAGYLNLPYLLWLTFAAYLNFGIWLLNR